MMTRGLDAEPCLPGMEPQGREVSKPKTRRKREKKRLSEDMVPTAIELVPGIKMLVFARAGRKTGGRHGW